MTLNRDLDLRRKAPSSNPRTFGGSTLLYIGRLRKSLILAASLMVAAIAPQSALSSPITIPDYSSTSSGNPTNSAEIAIFAGSVYGTRAAVFAYTAAYYNGKAAGVGSPGNTGFWLALPSAVPANGQTEVRMGFGSGPPFPATVLSITTPLGSVCSTGSVSLNANNVLIITLADGASCNLTATASNGASVSGTLSRTGSSYSVSSAVFNPPVTNAAPTASAGQDQTVASAAVVTLDGSASSDPDSDPLTYTWTQTSGTSVSLSDATAAQPSFTAPTLAVGDQDATLVFSLTVNDGTVSSVADTVTITVQAPTAVPPDAPTDLVATAGDAQVSLAFTAPANTGGNAITDYEYQLDGGNWVSAGTTTSPITITGLTNGTTYAIALRAVNAAGDGVASQPVSATPITTAAAPSDLVATAGDAQVSLAFTAPTNTGGSAITDYEYQLDGGNWVSAGTTTSPITITGLTNGTTYAIALRAVNAAGSGEASASISVNMPSPASEFAANEAAIREVIVDEAVRSLQSTISANQRMTRDARGRLIADQEGQDAGSEPSDVPFDVNGSLDVNGVSVSSKGTFYGSTSLADGTRRLMFGDFDVQHDGETGSSTATLTGRVAWERMVDERTLVGYFVGGELAHSNIAGTFSGDQNRVGLTVGGYAVHELADKTFLDGFLTLGAGRNNLEMANDVLTLESDYTTRSVTVGGALSGVIEQPGYEIWPELSISYGRTWIGDVGFMGAAYGLVDDTLSLDAGSVTLANIMFRPEFRVPLDGLSVADSMQLFSFAPRFICEQIKTTVTEDDCGGGAEIGISGKSSDGLSTYSAKIAADRLGDRTSTALQLNLEHRF